MKKILIDSGPLIALFDASDKYHSAAVDFLKANRYPLVTTIASVTETLHLLDFHRNAQLDFLEWICRGGVEIHPIENDAIERIKQLIEKYSDLPMDFADSCLVYLAEKLQLNTIVTVDRDFTIYRIKGRRKFKTINLEQSCMK
ncbi:MAG: PIN domain-containing protein [Deltaproteobacteria bacterium]|nr:PIN domain-containing protein [Deltaproteobacteria bacterium]MDL1962526.1 PIN domain-containing protein [Deltaproteobacteria bacterium]